MPIYAHVVGGVVQNLIVADALEIAEAVANPGVESVEATGTPAGIGWTYDPEAPDEEAFTAPPEPDPIPDPEV